MGEIDGNWRCQSCLTNGVQPRKDVIESIKVELRDGRYRLWRGERLLSDIHYSVDAAKEPKEIDLHGREPVARTTPGIYSIDSDILTLCFHMFGEFRPSAFRSDVGSYVDLKTFRRQSGCD